MAILKSKQLSTQLSGSYVITGSLETTTNISSSATSTGSFGAITMGEVIGNWTNAGNTVADGGTFSTITINAGTITGITDLAVADGGTGAGSFTDGGVLLGSGTSAITAMAVLSDGEMIVGDGSGDPVPESGATLRTSIGVGTTDNVSFAAISASGDISGSATSTGSFGYLNVDGDTVIGGNLTLGDADTDSISFGAEISSSLIPDADSTYDVGSSSKNWRYGYIEQVSATHITASGDISSSGDITLGHTTNYAGYVAGTTNYMFTNQSYQPSNGYSLGFLIASGSDIGGTAVKISGSSAGSFVGIGIPATTPLTTELTVEGSISASGDFLGSSTSTGSFGRVSTTGDIYSSGRIYESGTSVVDHATAMAIVFGG
jgi:hypothetical protein